MTRYERDGKAYVSVTQLINVFYPFNDAGFEKWCKSKGLDAQKILRDSERMGTKVSEWIENRTLGLEALDSPCTSELERGLKRAVEDFTGAYKIASCEQTVYCDEYGYAGTYDMECYLSKDTLFLCDSKTYGAWNGHYKRDSSKIKKVTMQVSMYAYAKYGEKAKNTKLALVVFKTDGSFEVEELKYTDKWKELIKEHQNEINLLFN